jgi:hypothetical protein
MQGRIQTYHFGVAKLWMKLIGILRKIKILNSTKKIFKFEHLELIYDGEIFNRIQHHVTVVNAGIIFLLVLCSNPLCKICEARYIYN